MANCDDAIDGDAIGADGGDLTLCDREPIRSPGSIQPHGLLLIADAATRRVSDGAGDIEGRLTLVWRDALVDDLLGADIAALLAARDSSVEEIILSGVEGLFERFDAILRLSGAHLLVELEPQDDVAPSAARVPAGFDDLPGGAGAASGLQALYDRAAVAFRALTGFDRVMIYRFLDDGSGVVLAEDREPRLGSFLDQHFPASDIPKQARALYVRNRVRVIPDMSYTPAPIRGAAGLDAIDLSDVALRSVSPIHLQYMRNMGVAASASVSIVRGDRLWGLVTCHNASPRRLSHKVRTAARALADDLAGRIGAEEGSADDRERLRLRAAEGAIVAHFDTASPLHRLIRDKGGELARMLDADGVAMLRGHDLVSGGTCPPEAALRRLAGDIAPLARVEPFHSNALATRIPAAEDHADTASGLLAVTVGRLDPALLMWFRAEERATVSWAGNPHKAVAHDADALPVPRTSFAAWHEEIRGRSRRWTPEEIASADRLRALLETQEPLA